MEHFNRMDIPRPGIHRYFDGFKYGLPLRPDHLEEDLSYHKQAWRKMRWIRSFETHLMENYKEPFLTRCPIHYCVGQEGVPAYISLLKHDGDYMFTHHRNHGYHLAWMESPRMLLAELMGKEESPNKGRAGSQEMSNPECRFHSGAILSTMIGIAAGAAFGLELDANWTGSGAGDPVVICAFGDGAADEGIFWEAMNLIALRGLPILLLCENNGYATFSSQGRRQARSILDRVRAFGVPAVYTGTGPGKLGAVLKQAMEHVREKRTPVFVEHMTYRHCGHVGVHNDDDQGYRPDNERSTWKVNDDLTVLEKELLRQGYLDAEMIEAAEEFDRKRFQLTWDTVSGIEDAKPIDYTKATISKASKIAIVIKDDPEPEEFREAILRPY